MRGMWRACDVTAMAMRLAREEGVFAGISTGESIVAALRVAEQMKPEETIVTVMCDTTSSNFIVLATSGYIAKLMPAFQW